MENIIRNIKKWIDSWNVNFLLGSGLSKPLLWTLQNIEKDLTEAEEKENISEIKKLKEQYFNECMVWNLKIIDKITEKNANETLENYKDFFKIMNYTLLKRENSILTKQINVFTTNIDILCEKALEDTWLEYNDWFHWKMKPKFNVGNFKKSIYRKSLHYENTSEIPIFNILKIHGSLSWEQGLKNKEILFDSNLYQVQNLESNFDLDEYNKLAIVNPKKTKFEDTVLNQYYYDLLRLYSNELEKENSLLFVMWFSFADEHIRDLTLRVANSNPTLKVYVFKYSPGNDDILIQLEKWAKNKNLEIVYPEWEIRYNFQTLNKEVFSKIVSYKKSEDFNKDLLNNEIKTDE